MRANTDPQGMTDDELDAAGQHHRSMAQAYRKLAEGEQSRQLAAARVTMAEGWRCEGCEHYPHALVQTAEARRAGRGT